MNLTCSSKRGQVLATDIWIVIVIVISLVPINIIFSLSRSLFSLVWLSLSASATSGHAGLLGFYPDMSQRVWQKYSTDLFLSGTIYNSLVVWNSKKEKKGKKVQNRNYMGDPILLTWVSSWERKVFCPFLGPGPTTLPCLNSTVTQDLSAVALDF